MFDFAFVPYIRSDAQEVVPCKSDADHSVINIKLTFKHYVFDPAKKLDNKLHVLFKLQCYIRTCIVCTIDNAHIIIC